MTLSRASSLVVVLFSDRVYLCLDFRNKFRPRVSVAYEAEDSASPGILTR